MRCIRRRSICRDNLYFCVKVTQRTRRLIFFWRPIIAPDEYNQPSPASDYVLACSIGAYSNFSRITVWLLLSHRTLVFPSCKSQYQCHAGHIHATNNMPSTSHIIQLHVRKLGHRGIELLFTFRSVKANAFAATSSSHCCSVTLLLCYRNRCRRHCRRKDFCFLKHSNSGCCRPTNCQYSITSKRTGLVTWLLGCGCVRLCAIGWLRG